MSTLSQWCQEQLSSLGCGVSEDLVKHLISMGNSEIKEYLSDMLDVANPIHQEFIEQFILKRKFGTEGNLVVYKKPGKVAEQNLSSKNSKRRVKDKQMEPTPFELQRVQQSKECEDANCKPQTPHSTAKKKSKFTSLCDGKVRDIFTFPGRQPCICQASKHSLVNNCLHCGRVVCQQEGSGPCFTCGNLVCTKAEQEILASNSKQSEMLLQKFFGVTNDRDMYPYRGKPEENSNLEKAIEHKNKLLEYDRTAERRTRVIDDEADYFSADALKWLPPEDQKKLKEKEEEMFAKKHMSRRNKKFTFDFAGRRITEGYDEPDCDLNIEHMHSMSNNALLAHDSANINPYLSVEPPQYENEKTGSKPKSATLLWDESTLRNKMRIQDGELQLMSDDGFCLSVHQPWASLLISGIKLHEGRSWYTPHRGRLWIHAGAKVPTRQEIKEAENSMTVISGNSYIKFPDQYPTGCLLGCVDVVDCLPQEEYRLQCPDGESGSPYVFICTNPQELIIKFPLQGKMKIFKMDPKLHQAAKKTLKKTHDVEK